MSTLPRLTRLNAIETEVLMQAVKHYRDRFPGDFMFPGLRGKS